MAISPVGETTEPMRANKSLFTLGRSSTVPQPKLKKHMETTADEISTAIDLLQIN